MGLIPTDPPAGETRSTDPIAQRPTIVAGRYRLLRELGRGGCAVVYLAEDSGVGQRVALKRMETLPDPQRLERIRREVQIGRTLSHPGLVRVFDLVEDPGGPAIIMERVEGPTLRQVLGERGALPEAEALAIYRQILEALGALHGAGILHRDVKPENIFLLPDGGVKLGDYSICLPMARTRLTVDGGAVGTLGYMAPEQMEGREARPASDLYAAAVVLYEMLTGRKPWREETPSQVIYAQLHRAPNLRAGAAAGLPVWMRRHLRRGLARRPSERFRSTEAAIRALERHRGGLAPAALLRRAGVAVLVLLAAGGVLWSYRDRAHGRVVSIELDGRDLVARNGLGKEHWRIALDAPPAALLVEDLDGDGRPEAFFAGAGPYPAKTSIPIFLVETDGKMAPIPDPVSLGVDQGLGGGYRVRLHTTDLDGDGSREVIGYASSVWYPTAGFVYSALQGRVTLSFRHPGHIAETAFADLTGNGALDIVMRAMNNALGHEGVLFALDGETASLGIAQYHADIDLPGWRSPEPSCSGAELFYTFLPHDGYVYSGKVGTFSWKDTAWRISPMTTTFEGDRWGNITGGPGEGMGAAGREAVKDYFQHIKGMMAAGLTGEPGRTVPESWILPARFQGRQPWDRVFRFVRARERIRCGSTNEGLDELSALAQEFPLDQEIHEALGIQTFLSTGDWEAGARLALENANRVLFLPPSGRASALKIRAIGGQVTPEEVEMQDQRFAGLCSELERARILMALGRWDEARDRARTIHESSPDPYRFGSDCCLAVLEAAGDGLTAETLKRARAEGGEYSDLHPMVLLAEAIESARRGGPDGQAQAETLLTPIRRAAAWDLDARLDLAVFERAVGKAR